MKRVLALQKMKVTLPLLQRFRQILVSRRAVLIIMANEDRKSRESEKNKRDDATQEAR